MRFQTQVKVMGIKFFNDEIEGKLINQTTIYVETALDDSRGSAKGFAVSEYKYPDSSLFESIKHLNYPLDAQLDLEIVTSGKLQKTVLRGMKPLTQKQ